MKKKVESQYSNIRRLQNIHGFATDMKGAGLICEVTHNVPAMLQEFQIILANMRTEQELKFYYQKLIDVLENLGGPATEIAGQLRLEENDQPHHMGPG